MLINCYILENLGYSKTKAHDLANQLCSHLPYTTKQIYIKTNRHENSEMLHNLRSVESGAVIKMCNDKIERAKTNKRVNVKQWSELKVKLENIYINA